MKSKTRRRVAITGIGLVCPIGTGKQVFWDNLLAGRHGIGPVESFDTSSMRVHRGAEVKDFDGTAYVGKLDPAGLGRTSLFAIAAARMALQDAGYRTGDVDSERAGVSMGTTSGEPNQIEVFNDLYRADASAEAGLDALQAYPCHLIPSLVASELDFAGPNLMIPTACAAGNYAIAYATDVLAAGQADFMLAGGADAFSRITYGGFGGLMAIAPDLCRPFDLKRRGIIPGEGSCVLVLEALEGARQRGARTYAEVAGYGLTCDAHHPTGADPTGRGAVRAMQQALAASAIRSDQVDYISAHGTGTKSNDLNETLAVKRVFGAAAHSIPISSIKSMLGHTMGAASALEAATCALAIRHGQVPMTANLENPDPECDLDYVVEGARQHPVEVAMNNAYAFGGNNASLILKKTEA